VFVQQGGHLIIGSGSLGFGTVVAGAGGKYAKDVGGSYTYTSGTLNGATGSAFGSGIFIENTSTSVAQAITVAPTLGSSLTISGVIADQAGSGGTGANATTAALVDDGAGTVILGATDTYSGGSTLEGGGTLELNASGAAGSGTISFSTGYGKLEIESAAFTNGNTFSNTVNDFVAGDVVDLAGLAFHSGASATVSASVLKVVSNGVTNSVNLSSSASSFAVLQDAGTGTDVIVNTFTITDTADLTNALLAINVGGVDSFASVDYTFDFVSSFAIGSTQTVDLVSSSQVTFTGGHATTGGGYEVEAGTLAANAIGAFGSGAMTVDSAGVLNLTSLNQTIGDLSGAGSIKLGTGTLTEGTSNSTTFSGTIAGTGVLTKQGSGELTLSHASSFTGGIALNAGTLDLTAATAAGTGTITFGAATGDILAFTSAAAPTANIISGVTIGQTLELTGQTITATNLINTNTLQINLQTGGPIDLTLNPGGTYAGDFFHFSNSGGNGFITESATPCYLAGTRVRTDRGEVTVEDLKIGDRVVTLSGALQPIKWIGTRSYASAFAAGNRDVIPIVIKVGALGRAVPVRDLYVSPLHAMFFDGVLIPAEHLVNGVSILRCPEIDPIRYFHIELGQHDVIYAEGAQAETFVDCDSRGMFHNAREFALLYPDAAAPKWVFCAPRVESGPQLERIRAVIETRAGLDPAAGGAADGPLEGCLDGIDGSSIRGWAFNPARPAVPVLLEVLDGDGVIARVRANRYRDDLEAAQIGDGRHAFELHLASGLSPAIRHELRVRRVSDGAELPNSPLAIEAREGPDLVAGARAVIEAAAARVTGNPAVLDALLITLLRGVDQVRRLRATQPRETESDRRLLRWTNDARALTKRALVIDDVLPRPDRDAGSNAVLGHIAALQALGWHVDFAASDEVSGGAAATTALEALGVTCHQAPYVSSVEEVLRRAQGRFDLVYLHRLSNAEAYAGLARAWQPRARILYSVADLHHLRVARLARLQASEELLAESRVLKCRELAAMRMADAVITHSTAEAAYLAREVPGAVVHVVPWALAPRPRSGPLAARRGVAFIGGFRHAPNPDAVRWLVSEVMPLVWQRDPTIPCLIVGSDWPIELPWLPDRRVELLGHLEVLDGVLSLVRLTVAPLRFGAGLKGKVLDSLAAGVPCVMTPIAAEGVPLPRLLRNSVTDDARTFATLICDLHSQPELHWAQVTAGLEMIGTHFTAASVEQAMAETLQPRYGGVVAPRLPTEAADEADTHHVCSPMVKRSVVRSPVVASREGGKRVGANRGRRTVPTTATA
jgi:autotransporter-associated beta strand protein